MWNGFTALQMLLNLRTAECVHTDSENRGENEERLRACRSQAARS
jgi:hypothetical protein